jgi:tetratricopeptide (TPR) repeat protein
MERLHKHPNIVKILDIATREKCASEGLPPYFIMEYVDGHSLEDFMKLDKGFTLDDVVNIMGCALSALQHCHDLGVVHRDIKPSNILITQNNEVRLTDFGIAKARKNTSKTGEGLTLGSTDFMSPEQALGKRDLDYRSDIYSLGVTLYYMVCDRLPFEGDSPNAVALKHIQEEPIPPIEINEAVPPKLNSIILKALKKDREDRFQSCNEMLEALKHLDEPKDEYDDRDETATFPAVDLTKIEPQEEDDNFVKDYDVATANHTAGNFAAKPPEALINALRVLFIILAFTGLFLAVFKGYNLITQANVTFDSRPEGAFVYLNGEKIGSCPLLLPLSPMGYLVSFGKEGYATSTMYFDLKARQNLKLKPQLLELNPEFPKFDAALTSLANRISSMPSKNFKTKRAQSRYESARADLNKKWKEAFTAFEQNIHYAEPGLRLIDLAKNTNSIERLENYFTDLTRRKPTAEAFTLAGLLQQEKGNSKEALRLFMEAWTRNANYKFLLNALGNYFIKENKSKKAIQYLEMSLFLYPEQPEIKEKLKELK